MNRSTGRHSQSAVATALQAVTCYSADSVAAVGIWVVWVRAGRVLECEWSARLDTEMPAVIRADAQDVVVIAVAPQRLAHPVTGRASVICEYLENKVGPAHRTGRPALPHHRLRHTSRTPTDRTLRRPARPADRGRIHPAQQLLPTRLCREETPHRTTRAPHRTRGRDRPGQTGKLLGLKETEASPRGTRVVSGVLWAVGCSGWYGTGRPGSEGSMRSAAIAILAALVGVFVSPVIATADTSRDTDCPTGLHVLVVCNKGYSSKASCDGDTSWTPGCVQGPDGRWWHIQYPPPPPEYWQRFG